jgi:hypothetical protein
LPSVVNRAAGLTINWTGGNPTDLVSINGVAAMLPNPITNPSAPPTGAEFLCYTTAGAKTFTVPPSILSQLPAIANGAGESILTVSSISSSPFNAPLTSGGSIPNATFTGAFLITALPAFQ